LIENLKHLDVDSGIWSGCIGGNDEIHHWKAKLLGLPNLESITIISSWGPKKGVDLTGLREEGILLNYIEDNKILLVDLEGFIVDIKEEAVIDLNTLAEQDLE
jgi:hypothetical protein